MSVIAAFKSAEAGLSIAQLLFELLETKTATVLMDVARIHIESARQALVAAEDSETAPGMLAETRVALGHLRDAFNALQEYLKRKKKYLLFFTGDFNPEEKQAIYRETTDIAVMISIGYARTGDPTANASRWRTVALRQFRLYCESRKIVARVESYDRITDRVHVPGPVTYGGGMRSETRSVFNEATYRRKLGEMRREYRDIITLLSPPSER